MTCVMRGCVVVMVLFFGAINSAAAEPKRVLLLHSFGPQFVPWVFFAAQFREELFKRSPEKIDLYEASLEGARFQQPDEQRPVVDYLVALFGTRKLDLIVTIGAPATVFVQNYRAQFFPSTPLVIGAPERRAINYSLLTPNDAPVAVTLDFSGWIENILQVLPDTTHIAWVVGASPLERFWTEEFRRAAQPFTDRVSFEWFNDLSFEDMLGRVSKLPSHSAIFFVDLRVDAAGVPLDRDLVLPRLRKATSAPIFSYIDSYLGSGIVGGPMLSSEEVGRRMAEAAVRILKGETPSDLKIPPVPVGSSQYDWRELRHWKISENRLPAGSIIRFREPPAWQQYRWQIALISAVMLLQAGLIYALLFERRKRQRSEAAAYELSGRLISAQEDERSRLARELHDDVTQRLALLAIEAERGERGLPAVAGGSANHAVRDGLARLSEDVHALSYRLHSSVLEDLGLVEALKAECETFARRESVRVAVKAPDILENLPRDVSLNLFRVAQEALRNVGRHAHAKAVEVSLRRLDGGVELAVHDDGVGFDIADRHDQPSLGHASMRQRVRLVGGEFDIDTALGRGTTVLTWVPLKESQDEARA